MGFASSLTLRVGLPYGLEELSMSRRNTDNWDFEDDAWEAEDEIEDIADDYDCTEPCPYCNREIHEDAERCPYCEQYVSQEDSPSTPISAGGKSTDIFSRSGPRSRLPFYK